MGGPSLEHERVRDHLERALACVSSAPSGSTTRKVGARRQALLRHLRAYIDAGSYPINEVTDDAIPIFVDDHGSRCAVAALIDATGHRDLAEHVTRTQNFARVGELVAEPAFTEWLAFYGLAAEEAARIQPAYSAHLDAEWSPTVSVISAADASYGKENGVEAILAAGARAGIRRNVRGSDDHGSSQYGSLALTLEYVRAVTVDRGATNQLGAILQWEPIGNLRDAQWYVLGGPLASIDGDSRPGSGFGGELGAGFSFRRREVPLLFEVVTRGLVQDGETTGRLGAQIGVVW